MSVSRKDLVRPGPQIDVPATTTGMFQVTALDTDATRATIRVQGEMDLDSADLLTGVLDSHLAAGRRFVRLDLSRLGFLDGSGLRVLVHAHNEFLAHDGALVLSGITDRIARLLRITQLDQALFIADAAGESGHARHLSSLPIPPSAPPPTAVVPLDPVR